MEGIIVNYRRGRKTQKTNQMIILLAGVDKKKAEGLVGKKVVFTCEGKAQKKITGEISAVHGSKGAVRAIFQTGMPGQAIGQKVVVQ